MGGEKDYLRAADYTDGRKQGHVPMGLIFSIPLNPGQLSIRQSMCDQVTF